jgi:hypothetical protein
METISFNQKEVEIASVSFSHNGSSLRFESYPRRLVYKGREYLLAEA